jgi:hypothetical protein
MEPHATDARTHIARLTAAGLLTLALLIGLALLFATGHLSNANAQASATEYQPSVLQACSNTTNGDLRIVANNETDCRAGETGVSWNVVGPQGPQGPKGDPGPQGSTGSTGPAGISGYDVESDTINLSTNMPAAGRNVPCPAGKVIVGGGYRSPADSGFVEDSNGPLLLNGLPPQWYVFGHITANTSVTVTVYAICANAG